MTLMNSLKRLRHLTRPRALHVLLGLGGVLNLPAVAQTVAPTSPAVAAPVSSSAAAASWSALRPAQQQALAPLAPHWQTLSDGQKRKWLAIASNFHTLSPLEQSKIHHRMVEWASLSQQERNLARLNFNQSKTLPIQNRTSSWEAYQALSPEEKKQLANSAPVRAPSGAVVVTKPISPDKLTQVPVTRHTPPEQRALVSPNTPNKGPAAAPGKLASGAVAASTPTTQTSSPAPSKP